MTSPPEQTKIEEFVSVARHYCEWAEASPGDAMSDLAKARSLLSELHFAVLRLPDLGTGEEIVKQRPQEEFEAQVRQRFGNLPVDEYWFVFNPLDATDRISIPNCLTDDLSDIWADLHKGLSLYDHGHVVEAVWEWRFGFEYHWGAHLLAAQRAIHHYYS